VSIESNHSKGITIAWLQVSVYMAVFMNEPKSVGNMAEYCPSVSKFDQEIALAGNVDRIGVFLKQCSLARTPRTVNVVMQVRIAQFHVDIEVAVRFGQPTVSQNAYDVSVVSRILQLEQSPCLALNKCSHRRSADVNDLSGECLSSATFSKSIPTSFWFVSNS